MICLTRLNNTQIWLNPHLIATVESSPDTIVVLTTGEKFMVQQTAAQVQQQFLAYQQAIRQPL